MGPHGPLRPEIKSPLVVGIQHSLLGSPVAPFLRRENKALVELLPVPKRLTPGLQPCLQTPPN